MVRTGNPFDQYTSGPPDDFADILMQLGYSQPINYPIRPNRPLPVLPSTNQTGINLDTTDFVPRVDTGFVPGTDIGLGGEPQPGDINILTAGLGGNIKLPTLPKIPEFKGITNAQRKDLQSLLESIQDIKYADWGVTAEQATEEYPEMTPAEHAEFSFRQFFKKYKQIMGTTTKAKVPLAPPWRSDNRDLEWEQKLMNAMSDSMFMDMPLFVQSDPNNTMLVGFEQVLPVLEDMFPDAKLPLAMPGNKINLIKQTYMMNRDVDFAERELRKAFSTKYHKAENYWQDYEYNKENYPTGIPQEALNIEVENNIKRIIDSWKAEIETETSYQGMGESDTGIDPDPTKGQQDLDDTVPGTDEKTDRWIDTGDPQRTREMPVISPFAGEWTESQKRNMNVNATTKAMHLDDYVRNNIRYRSSGPLEKRLFEFHQGYFLNPQFDVQTMLYETDANYGAYLHGGAMPWNKPMVQERLSRLKQLVGGNVWDPVKKAYFKFGEDIIDPAKDTVKQQVEKILGPGGYKIDIDKSMSPVQIATDYISDPDNVKQLIMWSALSGIRYGPATRWMIEPLSRSIDNFMNLNFSDQLNLLNMPGAAKEDQANARAQIGLGLYNEFAVGRNNNWLRTDEIKKKLDTLKTKDDNKQITNPSDLRFT